MSSWASRTLRTRCRPYLAVSNVFVAKVQQNLLAEVQAGADHWQDNGDIGLILEVLDAIPRSYIRSLQATHAVIPVASIASHSQVNQSLEDTLQLIQDMIASGELNATITNNAAPLLHMHATSETGPLYQSEQQLCQAVTEQLMRTSSLMDCVRLADERLVMSREHGWLTKSVNALALKDMSSTHPPPSSYDIPASRFGPDIAERMRVWEGLDMDMDLDVPPAEADEDIMNDW